MGIHKPKEELIFWFEHLDAKGRGALQPSPAIAIDLTGGANDALRGQTAALLQQGSWARYKSGFEAFFGAIEGFAARRGQLVPLAEFKREVVRTLLPMAPYLAGL